MEACRLVVSAGFAVEALGGPDQGKLAKHDHRDEDTQDDDDGDLLHISHLIIRKRFCDAQKDNVIFVEYVDQSDQMSVYIMKLLIKEIGSLLTGDLVLEMMMIMKMMIEGI